MDDIMTNDHLRSLRTQIEQFVKLPDADWQQLVPHVQLKQFNKHDLFSKEGKQANEVGLVLQGQLRQYYTIDGEERTTWFFFEKDLLCSYISCITKTPSLITIEALTAGSYLSFPYQFLEDAYRTSIAWQTFGRCVAEYIATGLEQRMVDLLTKRPEERYRSLLKQNGKMLEHIPLQYIANYLGITPVSMSRIRRRFYQ